MNLNDAIERLKQRVYYVRETSGQRYYYDSVTGDRNLTYMHLGELLNFYINSDLEEGAAREFVNYTTKSTDAYKAITTAHFRPILLNPIYVAGSESRIVQMQGNYYPNMWNKPEVVATEFQTLNKARKGAAPFIEHLQQMMGDSGDAKNLDDPASKAGYLIRMLAYRYQVHSFRDKQKPHVGFYLYGKQGYGKGILADTLTAVFGESAVMKVPDEQSLESMSSVDVFSRTWAIVDEVNIKKGSTNYNKIKTHTGSTYVSTARKGEHFRSWYIPAQLFMFSNHPPTFIEANDRRFFVTRWDCEFPSESAKRDYFEQYTSWLQNGGYEAIAGLLSKTKADVATAQEAMMTPEKQQVVQMVTDDVVTEIKLMMEQRHWWICFEAETFKDIWRMYGISRAQQKYKLQEAGLVETAKRKYEGKKTKTLFVRDGWELEVQNGKPATLRNKHDPKANTLLKDDIGYQVVMEQRDWDDEDADDRRKRMGAQWYSERDL